MYALALEGGGALGAAHVGVLRALVEAELIPEAISGTSAGAMAAATYAWRGRVADVEALFEACHQLGHKLLDLDVRGITVGLLDKVFRGKLTIQGLYRGDRLLRLMEELTGGAALADAKVPLAVTAVDVVTEREVVFSSRFGRQQGVGHWITDATIAQAVRASTAIPGAFCPLHFWDMVLVDGGVVESLPATTLRRITSKPVLGVMLRSPREAKKAPGDVIGILMGSLGAMRRRLEMIEKHAAQSVLRVSVPAGIGVFSFERMEELVEIGYECARRALPRIKAELANTKLILKVP
ncbi:MAG: patatin-like phospholipase family protein [Clostridia bacterium]|nr:patatin-like phospholipase family protein [Clostridia bacterium]